MNRAASELTPYYAVIFTTERTEGDNGYEAMSHAMEQLVAKQPGFLGVESARSALGITVSYWSSLEAITAWKNNAAHQVAQTEGKLQWYKFFKLRVCKVEREYSFEA